MVDCALNSIDYLFASLLFCCIDIKMPIGAGIALRGLERLDKAFVEKYNKSAIYFADPYAFPDEYSVVPTETGEKAGKILLAFFISEPEYEYLVEYGADKFETLLEEKNVDPFNLSRVSAV